LRKIIANNLPLKLLAIETGDQATLQRDLAEWLSKLAEQRREVLLFIHGYNVSFKDAAIRAAQLGYDLKLHGPTVFYSWPSRNRVVRYSPDEATIEDSEKHLTAFLKILLAVPGLQAINIIAHSMGNRLLYRAAQELDSDLKSRPEPSRIGHVILASPDMRRGKFKDAATIYSKVRDSGRRTTLYWNRADLPVNISATVHDDDRVGIFGADIPATDSIRWMNRKFSLKKFAHSYFAEAGPVLHDIRDVLLTNSPPAERVSLIPVPTDYPQYWELS
jgi:esterase/lipase superfamily enzyme